MSSDREFRLFGAAFRGSELVESPAMANAREHMRRSMVVTAVAPVFAIGVLFLVGSSVGTALVCGVAATYLAWSCYWGFVGLSDKAAEDRWRKGLKDAWEAGAVTSSRVTLLFPLLVALAFGPLGGGIYFFLRYRKLAAEAAREG